MRISFCVALLQLQVAMHEHHGIRMTQAASCFMLQCSALWRSLRCKGSELRDRR